jgi:hypothetical protein
MVGRLKNDQVSAISRAAWRRTVIRKVSTSQVSMSTSGALMSPITVPFASSTGRPGSSDNLRCMSLSPFLPAVCTGKS